MLDAVVVVERTKGFDEVEAERRGVFGPVECVVVVLDNADKFDAVRTTLVDPATEVDFSTSRVFEETNPLLPTSTPGKLGGGTEDIRLLESDGIWLLDILFDARVTTGTGTGTSTAAASSSSILFDLVFGLLGAESARTVVLPLNIDKDRRLFGRSLAIRFGCW
jgi:hypothetical protein